MRHLASRQLGSTALKLRYLISQHQPLMDGNNRKLSWGDLLQESLSIGPLTQG